MDIYNILRPRKFNDMFPTSSFLRNIDNRVKNKLHGNDSSLGHIYMFYSTLPGCGKTSTSRILASELNPGIDNIIKENIFKGIDTDVCTHISGITDRKLDKITFLIERMESLRNSLWPYNYVFIIDEAHELTNTAIDALLIPTERIANNVYLIMTTTKIQHFQIPGSPGEMLLSRCEKHEFKRLTKEDTIKLIHDSANKLSTTIDNIVANEIEIESKGKPRDTILLLNQYIQTGKISKIDPEDTENNNSPFNKLIQMYTNHIETGNISWKTTFSKLIMSMLNRFSAEEIRIKLMQRTFGIIMDGKDKTSKLCSFYIEMGEILKNPINPPPKSDLIVRLFKLYIYARSLNKS